MGLFFNLFVYANFGLEIIPLEWLEKKSKGEEEKKQNRINETDENKLYDYFVFSSFHTLRV